MNPKPNQPESERDMERAIELIRLERKASTSFLQRRLRWGYVHAKRVLDELAKRGFVKQGKEPHLFELTERTISPQSEYYFLNGWKTIAPEVYAIGKASGFYDGEFNDAEKIALMHSELSEALEGLRKDLMDDKLPHRKMVEVELADTIIRIMNYATHRGLDVAGALVEKARFNAKRGFKHEGKKF